MSSSSRGRGRGRGRGSGTDQRDAAGSSGGFGSGLLAGIGIAAGGLLLGYGLSQMIDDSQLEEEETRQRRRPRPSNDLPPRTRTSTAQNTEDIPEDKRCVVCLTQEKEVIVLDCGHVCLCINCGHQIMEQHHPKCPICRSPIDSLKKFYL